MQTDWCRSIGKRNMYLQTIKLEESSIQFGCLCETSHSDHQSHRKFWVIWTISYPHEERFCFLPFQFKGTVFRRGTNMEYRVFGPNELTFDFCELLNGNFSHIIASWMSTYIRRLSKESNLFHPCPFSVREIFTNELQ